MPRPTSSDASVRRKAAARSIASSTPRSCRRRPSRRYAPRAPWLSPNPGFIHFGGERYLRTVPPEQQPWLYRIGALHRAGVPLAFGSDAPVETPEPLAELAAAVTRSSSEGGLLGSASEAVAADDAFRIAIRGGAHAAGAGAWSGALRPGMAADLVLLDSDPFRRNPAEWPHLRVLATIAAGRVAWEA